MVKNYDGIQEQRSQIEDEQARSEGSEDEEDYDCTSIHGMRMPSEDPRAIPHDDSDIELINRLEYERYFGRR